MRGATTVLRNDGPNGTAESTTVFLPVVDVLRAVAIAGVVGYHVFPDALPGGVVGVDVFFVVSGFLILGQLTASLRSGTFSLAGFYRRRMLRILPPYAIVVCLTTVAACLVLVTPQELRAYRADLLWSGLMAANLHYADVIGYFDSLADRHVLLHLWSLGVEEQFYLVAPLALMILCPRAGAQFARWRLTLMALVAVLLGIVSFVALLDSADRPTRAFYLPQFRVWELLLGGAASWVIPRIRPVGPRLRDAAIVAGLSAIALAMAGYPVRITYPGWYTLLPAFGAALVIIAGAGHDGLLMRVLAIRPVLYVALISYELYLWH